MTATRQQLVAQAASALARYPQYDGHFASYVLVRITRTVKTKMGVAFTKGELAIASPLVHEGVRFDGVVTGVFYTVYSQSNNCDTSVPAKDVEVL